MIALIKRDGKAIGITEAHESLGALKWFHDNVHAYSMDHATQHEGYSVDYVEEVDCHDVEPLITAIAERVGLKMESTFIPLSQSRNAKPGKDGKVWRSLNWQVRLYRYGKGFETDYSQGEAHTPAYKLAAKRLRHEAVEIEIETGHKARTAANETMVLASTAAIPAPSIGEVLQSLARDSDVLDSGGFEEWASEYGYDADSREAERIYSACIDIATKLRRELGAPLVDEIRLAAQFN